LKNILLATNLLDTNSTQPCCQACTCQLTNSILRHNTWIS